MPFTPWGATRRAGVTPGSGDVPWPHSCASAPQVLLEWRAAASVQVYFREQADGAVREAQLVLRRGKWGPLDGGCSVMSDSLSPRGPQHARLPCPSLSPGVCMNSCPLSQ